MRSQGLTEATIAAFRAGMRSPVIAPGAADYETARQVYNGIIDRFPCLMAQGV